LFVSGTEQGIHEKKLLTKLLEKYNVLERPVANESEPLEVKFGLTLQQIIDVVSLCFRVLSVVPKHDVTVTPNNG
jgi:hypothetical protein